MLKSVQIDNFQSHKKSIVEFSDKVTAFLGVNNHGKSAIIRALYKLYRNLPSGTSFVKDIPVKETECLITAEIDGNKITRRVRTDNAANNNQYVINDSEEYTKFGRVNIPEEVLAYLQISDPLDLGKNNPTLDLNFQLQLDDLFLVKGDGLTSTRSKVINRLTGTEKIHQGIAEANTRIKRCNSSITADNAVLEEKNTKINQLQYIFEVDKKHQNVLASIGLVKQAQEKIEKYISLQTAIRNIIQSAHICKDKITAVEGYDAAGDIEKITVKLTTITTLRQIISLSNQIEEISQKASIIVPTGLDIIERKLRILQLLKDLYQIETAITAIQERKDIVVNVDFTVIESTLNKVEKLKQLQNTITSIDTRSEVLQSHLIEYDKKLEENTQKITDTRLELKVPSNISEFILHYQTENKVQIIDGEMYYHFIDVCNMVDEFKNKV